MDELEVIRQRKLEELKKGIKVRKMGSLVQATDAGFDELLSENGLLLVDFWAEWCGPCRMLAPVIDEIAREYEGRLVVAKLDVDHNQRTAMRFGVMSIPTLILFENGKVQEKIVGAVPKSMIRDKIDAHLR